MIGGYMPNPPERFGFGKNWDNFIRKYFNDERVEISRKHMLEVLGKSDLRGLYFVDVGCGSGLHSLAALRAGAERVVGFDYDQNSVDTSLRVKNHVGNPSNWAVRQGSILDAQFIAALEPADIVYAWGVLHHTGAMWQAMDHTVRLMKTGGLAYIALYDYDIQVDPTPEFWLDIKKQYNVASAWGKRRLELWYIWNFTLGRRLYYLPVLIKIILGYRHGRGMAFYTDLVDWLGGWPMEFAKREDVTKWAERHNLTMVKMITGQANTEYLFRR